MKSVIIVEALDEVFSYEEIKKMPFKNFKQLCGFLEEKQLQKLLHYGLSDSKKAYICNIFDRL